MPDEPNTEKEVVKETLKEAVQNIQSPDDAERVLDELEKVASDVSEAQAAKGTEATPAKPAEAVVQAARAAPPEHEATATLAAVAAESIAPQAKGEKTLEAAQELFLPESRAERPPLEIVKPRGYLQEAVLRRMNPLQAWDAWLFIAVNHLPHTKLSNTLMYTLTAVTIGGLAWYAGTVYSWLHGVRGGRRAVREMAVATTLATWIVEYPIKAYFRRKRPFIDIVRALVIGKKPGSWSFPSGHTASSFASARVLSSVWPRKTPLFYALASLVGFSRVYLGAHYPGDVLAGAISGTVVSEVARRALRAVLARK
jgi:membrane-associated phospholipid phosphatase